MSPLTVKLSKQICHALCPGSTGVYSFSIVQKLSAGYWSLVVDGSLFSSGVIATTHFILDKTTVSRHTRSRISTRKGKKMKRALLRLATQSCLPSERKPSSITFTFYSSVVS